jgi:HEAT repeat protein
VANSDASPALRVYAAQALRRSGDPYGRQILLRMMDEPDWVVRSMAIYYLGELGEKDDYHRVAVKLNTEDNDFVLSEICNAMLKLASI